MPDHQEVNVISDDIESHNRGCMQSMAGTDHKKEQIKAAYVEQAEILHLKVTIMTGWPNEKRECTVAIESYWNF